MRLTATVLAATLGGALPAAAECAFDNDVPVSILAPGFEAWKAIAAAMEECGSVEASLDQEFRSKQPDALAADPALYSVAGVNAATFATLSERELIRPLDELIAEHGQGIAERQKVAIDGEVMAIAVMVNNQNLFYRRDVFEELGLEPPATYAEMLDVAAEIEAAGVVEYPIGGTFATGFDIGEEFVNMYLGYGGALVGGGNEVALDREAGIAALETLAAMTGYMDPEYTISDSTYVQQQFQQGKIAMANLWASRAGAMDDPAESQVVGLVASAAAPSAVEGGPPASTQWWGGWTIAANVTDEEAEAAFRVMVEATDEEMVRANNDANIWLIDGYEPPEIARGAIETLTAGAPNYPASSAMALLHTELGNAVPSFLTGERSAEETLAEIERRYETAAVEAGLIDG